MVGSLRAAGFEADHVIDAGIRGQHDDQVFRHARRNSFVLITADLGFSNILRFALGDHAGIVVCRFPNEISSTRLNESIVGALREVSEAELKGALLILRPGSIRLRKP